MGENPLTQEHVWSVEGQQGGPCGWKLAGGRGREGTRSEVRGDKADLWCRTLCFMVMILLSDGGTRAKVLSRGLSQLGFPERPLAAAWEKGGSEYRTGAQPRGHC